jgi:hypothetical protein
VSEIAKPLKLDLIRIDADTQTRDELHFPTVRDYAEDMSDGDKFPPVVVFFDGTEYFLADGFHRCAAAKANLFKDILAEVRPGTRLDALKYSLGANTQNGLRRSREDKRRSVAIALREFQDLSDRGIAELTKTSHPFVADMRKEIAADQKFQRELQAKAAAWETGGNVSTCPNQDTPPTRTGKDGKVYSISKAQKLATQPTEAEEPRIHSADEEMADASFGRSEPATNRWECADTYFKYACGALTRMNPNHPDQAATLDKVIAWCQRNKKTKSWSEIRAGDKEIADADSLIDHWSRSKQRDRATLIDHIMSGKDLSLPPLLQRRRMGMAKRCWKKFSAEDRRYFLGCITDDPDTRAMMQKTLEAYA